MEARQGIKSITMSRKIIRADGTEEPEEVVAYYDQDPDAMARVLGGGNGLHIESDGTVLPRAGEVRAIQPSEQLLGMTREELEGNRP